jgi:hypothetical protein
MVDFWWPVSRNYIVFKNSELQIKKPSNDSELPNLDWNIHFLMVPDLAFVSDFN